VRIKITRGGSRAESFTNSGKGKEIIIQAKSPRRPTRAEQEGPLKLAERVRLTQKEVGFFHAWENHYTGCHRGKQEKKSAPDPSTSEGSKCFPGDENKIRDSLREDVTNVSYLVGKDEEAARSARKGGNRGRQGVGIRSKQGGGKKTMAK